jgi:hypothetical protein
MRGLGTENSGDDICKDRHVESRLALNHASVPTLKKARTWKQIEAIAREEHAREAAREGLELDAGSE